MRIGLAIVLNLLFALGLGYWLRCEYYRAAPQVRRWLLPALGLRIGAGLLQIGPDTQHMNLWGRILTMNLQEHLASAWALLQGHSIQGDGPPYVLYEWSNTLFIIKILSLLNFASLGYLWLNGLYISTLVFMCCWWLVRTMGHLFPAASTSAGVVAFLLWPSVVWWTAGITKEALVLSSAAVLIAIVCSKFYNYEPTRWRLGQWVVLVGVGWLHIRLRYFFALPLLGSLLALVVVVVAERRGWMRTGWLGQFAALLGGLVLVGALATAVGGESLSNAFVTSQLWTNYTHGLVTSVGRPHLEYYGLQPTVGSMAMHFPLAAAETIVRPWLGESMVLSYLVVSLENILLLCLLLSAAVAVKRGRAGWLPPALVLALLLYCLVLAALIGLSTPNLGTLHRYRAAFMPWLLWLLLQNDYARRLLGWLKMDS